jgi:peptide/nickel transport system substrate-binding protein
MVIKLVTLLAIIVVLAVACGGAPAAPDPNTAPADEPTAAPGVGETSQPTATPQAMAPPAQAAVNPGEVTWMVGSFGNERFDYTFAAGTGHDYARQIHGFLISSDVEGGKRVFVPGIASEWSLSDDGLTTTFTIREGVKFHDGTEVTAEDVLWTLQHIFGPQAKEYGTSITNLLTPVLDRFEQTGPDQVSATFKVPSPDFFSEVSDAAGDWIAILPKRSTMHNLEEEAAYDQNPIGAGIMKLVNHVPVESMTFERFDDYYYQPKYGLPSDKRVNFQTLRMFLVPEEATRVAALRAGEADIAPVSIASRKQVEAGGGRIVFGQEGVYFNIKLLGCWKAQWPCQDKRVRQALEYAIDKETMRDKLYGGPEVMQVKGWLGVTPSTIGYTPELDPFPYDPDKARQLLADAGYPGGQGFGKVIVDTWVSTSLPLMPESAQLAADDWRRELGLDVEVRVGDETALKKAYTLTEDLYGHVLWRDNETRIDAARLMRSDYTNPDVKTTLHNDPELFELTNKALTVYDSAEREKVLNSTYRRLWDESYELGIGYVNIPWAVGPRILSWEPLPLAFYPSALHTITLK